MRWSAISLAFLTTLSFASSCPDPRVRQAVIGGDTFNGVVLVHGKPVKFAQMRLYSSSGKTAWVGRSGKDGHFATEHLPPDTYRLKVRGWGSATIRLHSTLTQLPNGQVPNWALQLMDNECVAYGNR